MGESVTGTREPPAPAPASAATPPSVAPAGAVQGILLIGLMSLPTLAIASLVPVLPSLMTQFRSVPHGDFLVPMILTVPSLCVALFSTPLGAVADFWGRRRLLIVALMCFAGFGVLPMFVDSLYAIVACRFAVGLAEAAILTTGNTLMGDYFSDEPRRKWLGLQSTVGPFVGSAYIVAGGALGSWSWRGPFALYLLGAVALAGVVPFLWEPSATKPRAEDSSRTRSRFPWATSAVIGSATIGIGIIYFIQAVQHGRIFADLGVTSPARISWIVTLASMGTVAGGYLFRRLPKWGIGRVLSLCLAGFGIGYLGLGLAPGYLVGLPFDALAQMAGGITIPALVAWALRSYDFEHRGRGMGLWGGCFFLGQFLSPPVLTLIGRFGLSFLNVVALLGGFCLLVAMVGWFLGRADGAWEAREEGASRKGAP